MLKQSKYKTLLVISSIREKKKRAATEWQRRCADEDSFKSYYMFSDLSRYYDNNSENIQFASN